MSTKKYASGIVSRDNILFAARSCFAQRGFFETSMSDIEKAANTSRGVIYHHFENKDQMIFAIIAENLGNAAAKIEADLISLQTSSDGDLKQLLTGMLKVVDEITMGPGKAMSVHVWSLSMLRPEVKTNMLSFFERMRYLLKLQLIELQRKQKIAASADVEKLATALFSIQIPAYIVQRLFLEDHALIVEDFAQAMMDLFKPSDPEPKFPAAGNCQRG